MQTGEIVYTYSIVAVALKALVPSWFPPGSLLVPSWYPPDSLLVPSWYPLTVESSHPSRCGAWCYTPLGVVRGDGTGSCSSPSRPVSRSEGLVGLTTRYIVAPAY